MHKYKGATKINLPHISIGGSDNKDGSNKINNDSQENKIGGSGGGCMVSMTNIMRGNSIPSRMSVISDGIGVAVTDNNNNNNMIMHGYNVNSKDNNTTEGDDEEEEGGGGGVGGGGLTPSPLPDDHMFPVFGLIRADSNISLEHSHSYVYIY